MNNVAYISLGSNINDRLVYLKQAIAALEVDSNIEITKISSIYETEPVGYTEQAAFLNMVIELKSSYSADVLLQKCLEVEENLGRERKIRWGPRVIDLDLLLYNENIQQTEQLILPHPRMYERAFVMIPLQEIAPNKYLPVIQMRIDEVVDGLSDKEGVILWKQTDVADVSGLLEN